MDIKYNPEIDHEINIVLNRIEFWKELFDIKVEYYIDGWAIFLKEKTLYPRLIVLFKSSQGFSIKSFEIHVENFQNEIYKELILLENILDVEGALKELRAVIYGKDLIKAVYKKYSKYFSK